MVNPALYDSATGTTRELNQLLKDFRANPKKFLTIQVEVILRGGEAQVLNFLLNLKAKLFSHPVLQLVYDPNQVGRCTVAVVVIKLAW